MTKRNIISVEVSEQLENLLKQYAAFTGDNKSKSIRNLLVDALYAKTRWVQFQRLEEYLSRRDPFKFRSECEKCHRTSNLVIFYIDGNVENSQANNVITLCKNCLTEFELFRLKFNVKERFVEWFFR